MMGKDEIDLERELTDLDLSAISEAMNQMMGSSATSLSEIFMKKIDIEPPRSYEITVNEGRETLEVLRGDEPIIKVSFKMVVEDLIDSELMQLLPLSFGQDMVKNLLGDSVIEDQIEESIETTNEIPQAPPKKETDTIKPHYEERSAKIERKAVSEEAIEKEAVMVSKPQFETFDTVENFGYNETIDLVGDIPVEITVELGRTTKKNWRNIRIWTRNSFRVRQISR